MDLFAIDAELDMIYTQLTKIKDWRTKAGAAIREAIDGVIDGRNTGRYGIEQLVKTEKTYIGTRVENSILHALDLPKYQQIDTRINGAKVDIKFSIRGQWEIPAEAIGECCLLVSADDNASKFNLGLIRATEEVLSPGRNRDGKRKLSAQGKQTIRWLVQDAPLPVNFLLHLDPVLRTPIMEKPTGQQRVNELFKLCTGMIIDGVTVETVARQRDSSKRVRDARKHLSPLGLDIYSHYDNGQLEASPVGHLQRGQFVSLRVGIDVARPSSQQKRRD